MADIAYAVLFLAIVASLYSAVAFALGIRKRQTAFVVSAGNGIIAVCGLVSVSVAILLWALITHDFGIEYVASYSSRETSLPYLVSALWAGNSGSLLFWAWLLSIFASVVLLKSRGRNKELYAYASMIIMITEAFFLFLVVYLANPFHELSVAPPDGMGLNPVLENPGMIVHPPLLLAGYVGMTIPFAFAIASLLIGKLSDDWIAAIRRWMLLAWLLLGIGNIIGAWWAYVELGWGGYWAWDPVENAGLMPWLTATAFLHSSMAQKRRGLFKVWNTVLIILSFCLVIFGTFLTRSGVLSSVHSFGESSLGPFFLAFIIVALFGAFSLVYYRYEDLKGTVEVESIVSRESTFLLNNILLIGSTVAIFIGTIFPALSEAIAGVKVSMGASFFSNVNGPIFLAIIVLIGICTLISWRRASALKLIRTFAWPFLIALILVIGIFIAGIREWYALVAFYICCFVYFAILYQWLREVRSRHQAKTENYLKSFWRLLNVNRPRYGGYIIHFAAVIIAVGIVGSSFYTEEKEFTLLPGKSMDISKYTLTYDDMEYNETQSKLVLTAVVSVYRQGEFIDKLKPEKYLHKNYEQPVTEVAIRSTVLEDLYIILAGWDKDGTAAFKVLVNPLVLWIWVGGVIFLLGGVLAFWSDRWKLQASPKVEQGGKN